MARCEVCGNEYDKSFEITAAGVRHTFDSFECAIHKMAPVCEHCGCKVIGHGVEVDGHFFCCAHCVRQGTGLDEATDRVETDDATLPAGVGSGDRVDTEVGTGVPS